MAQEELLADVPLHGGAVPPAGLAWLELGTRLRRAKGGERAQWGSMETGKETGMIQESLSKEMGSPMSWTVIPATAVSVRTGLHWERTPPLTGT